MTDRWLTAIGLGFVCAAAMLAAGLELLLVPLYSGGSLVPIAVLFAVASNIALPLLGRSLAESTGATIAPLAAWALVALVLGFYPRPEGDVILPGGGTVQWVSYGVVLGGLIAGAVTVGLATARPPG